MKKVLIAYTTNAGSTEDVARVIGEEIGKSGCTVEVRRLEEVTSAAGYEAVVVGAPMILGWSRPALNFVKKHQQELSQARVAYFCTAMSLTQPGPDEKAQVPVCVDPGLAKPPQNSQRLSIKENYARLSNYLRPILRAAPAVQPVSVGFFGGKLEIFRLKWWQALFVMVIIQAQPGDLRNWSVVREWAGQMRSALLEN